MIKRVLMLSLFVAAGSSSANEPTAKPDLAKAQQTASGICAACHGADGNSTAPINPKLAGQHPEYLYKQLRNFKSVDGKPAERNNAVMGGMVAALSDADMKDLATYFSGQKLKPDAAKDPKTIELGQKLYRAGDASKGLAACAACHGPAGAGIPSQYPRVAGQYSDYLEAQLKLFRSGERANDPNQAMRMIAIKLTDPEIKALSNYMAGLR